MSAAPAPVIETGRLRLRGHGLADFDACLALWGDPEVTRFIGGMPQSAEEVWARLLRYAGHWTLLGFGFWLVEDKATGRFVGEAGLFDARRDLDPPFGAMKEAGWVLAPTAHGQGYATEAMRAVLAWHDARFTAAPVACMIHPDNAASLRVAERCGFQTYARTDYKGAPVVLLQRSQP